MPNVRREDSVGGKGVDRRVRGLSCENAPWASAVGRTPRKGDISDWELNEGGSEGVRKSRALPLAVGPGRRVGKRITGHWAPRGLESRGRRQLVLQLKHTVPATQLIEVRVAAGPVGAGAAGAVHPPGAPALPARLERGVAVGPGPFLFAGPIALLTRDLPVSTALWAKLHCGTTSVV